MEDKLLPVRRNYGFGIGQQRYYEESKRYLQRFNELYVDKQTLGIYNTASNRPPETKLKIIHVFSIIYNLSLDQ